MAFPGSRGSWSPRGDPLTLEEQLPGHWISSKPLARKGMGDINLIEPPKETPGEMTASNRQDRISYMRMQRISEGD